MNEDKKERVDLRIRTKEFALRVIKLYSALPKTTLAQTLGKQLLRSGTSVGAQFREAHRSRSDAEFISKIESSLQELDESIYWLELIVDAEIFSQKRVEELMKEADELVAVLTTCVKNVKKKRS